MQNLMTKAELRNLVANTTAPIRVLKPRKTASVKFHSPDYAHAYDAETGERVKRKRYEARPVASWQKQLPCFKYHEVTREVYLVKNV
jgi:hypothetical protein